MNEKFKGYGIALENIYSELIRIEKIYTDKKTDSFTIIQQLKALCKNMLKQPLYYTNGKIDKK